MPACLGSSCDFGANFDVHRTKRIASLLNVKTDRVDNILGTGNGCLYRALVMYIRDDLLGSSVLAQLAMARDYADSGAGLAQMAHDRMANKAGPAKHGCAAHSAIRQTILCGALD
jgi:hypothetical protein